MTPSPCWTFSYKHFATEFRANLPRVAGTSWWPHTIQTVTGEGTELQSWGQRGLLRTGTSRHRAVAACTCLVHSQETAKMPWKDQWQEGAGVGRLLH